MIGGVPTERVFRQRNWNVKGGTLIAFAGASLVKWFINTLLRVPLLLYGEKLLFTLCIRVAPPPQDWEILTINFN